MRRLLVTGGAGFIGSNFVRYWFDRYPDDRIFVLDALTYAGNVSNISQLIGDRCNFVHGSIIDSALVTRLLVENSIDVVVHFAAESHVDRSITGPDAFIQTNVVGTHNLLAACRTAWLDGEKRKHHFHHISTDEVYGTLGPNDPPSRENASYAPNSPYSASKAAADYLVRAYQHTYGLSATISNCSNNYGPYHFPEKLIPLTIVNLLTGKKIPVYGRGLNVRDWLHVDDHCAAIDVILRTGRPGETYNIGANCERNNLEVVEAICDIIDSEFLVDSKLIKRFPSAIASSEKSSRSAITFVPDRLGHDFRYAIDAKKLESELGFSCSVAFDAGLRETIRWFLSNEQWWRDVMNGSYRDYIQKSYGPLTDPGDDA